MIAGLRRLAASLRLHFVASPQRVPASGYRRRGSPVVIVIDRAPPRRDCYRTGPASRLPTWESIRLRAWYPRQPIPTTAALSASSDPPTSSPATSSGYAERTAVSSLGFWCGFGATNLVGAGNNKPRRSGAVQGRNRLLLAECRHRNWDVVGYGACADPAFTRVRRCRRHAPR